MALSRDGKGACGWWMEIPGPGRLWGLCLPCFTCPHCCPSSSSRVLRTCLHFVTLGFSESFFPSSCLLDGWSLPALSLFLSSPLLLCLHPIHLPLLLLLLPLPIPFFFSASDADLSLAPTCSPSVIVGVFRQGLSFATQSGFKLRSRLSLPTAGIIDRHHPA